MPTPSSQASKLAQLVAKALAAAWSGADPAAEPVRKACTDMFASMFSRADSVTGGATSKYFAQLLQEHLKRNPAPNADKSGRSSPEEMAARDMAAMLFRFLPAELRTLEALLATFQADRKTRAGAAPTAAPEPAAGDDAFGSPDMRDLFFSGGELAATWPNRDKLAREIWGKLKKLGAKFDCVGALGDIALWGEQVPLQAAASFGVAAAIQNAFKGLALTGISKSSLSLGNQVHQHLERFAARALAPQLDRYLVAENWVHLPGGGRVNLDVQSGVNRARKEFSLMCLINARRQMDDVVRSKGAKTSRDDLVVFYKTDFSWTAALLRDGRPEVYEIKPVDSLVQAVSQVTSYSFNYLTASVRLRCAYLLTQPLARLDNTLMLPASAENHSIPIPTLAVTDIPAVAALGAAPPIAAAKLAVMVSTFMAAAFTAPPKVAVPFMISGLYGIIPYFVLEIGPQMQAVLQAIVQALIAAILAYLAAQKAFEELLGEVATALGELLPLLAAFILLCVVLFLAWPLILGVLEAATVGLAIALAAGLILVIAAETGHKQRDTEQVDPDGTPLTMTMGPLCVQGLTAVQIAAFARALDQGLHAFVRRGALTSAGANGFASV